MWWRPASTRLQWGQMAVSYVGLAFLGGTRSYVLDAELAEPPQLLAEGLGGLNSFEFGADSDTLRPVMDRGEVVRIDVNSDPTPNRDRGCGTGWTCSRQVRCCRRPVHAGGPGHRPYRPDDGRSGDDGEHPLGLDNFAIDDAGRLFVSLITEGTIAEVMADGTLRMLGATGLVLPGGLASFCPPQKRRDGLSGRFLDAAPSSTAPPAQWWHDPLGIPGGTVAADQPRPGAHQQFCQRGGSLESADRPRC